MGREVRLRARRGVYVAVVPLNHLNGVTVVEVIPNQAPECVGGPGH